MDATVANNLAQVTSLFNDTDGIAKQLDSVITGYTTSDGTIAIRTNALVADIKSLSDQQDQLQVFAAQLTSSFNQSFGSLNTILAQAQSNQNYLSALFGGENRNGALSANSE
ncbi:flagellar filament capping protein FliD [Paraburkholderia humisilvae]|uniref:flagellar filament capping protein FliD n=1 Tax=Paraburkholderia humisilvae TaxID=627669 RepID=UPI003607FA08